MARELAVHHERILNDYMIADPDTLWRWCKFVRCTIDIRVTSQRFHQCEFEDCVQYPPQKQK